MPKYFGSKDAPGLFQNIISIMPPHDTYIETHLGGGTIMKRKLRSQKNIGLDLDGDALKNFNCDYSVSLINTCSHTFLRTYKFCGSELIYCDPPYLIETRRSNRKYKFDYTIKDHIELLELLNELPCDIILSGYPSKLYDSYLTEWNKIELQVMSQSGPRTEVIWHNYQIDKLFWSTFAGKNAAKRQDLKRKVERWRKNYKKMPRRERLAIMSALMDIESTSSDHGSVN
jgi:hypothetical protein